MTTGFGVELKGVALQNHAPTPSACELFGEAIELVLSRGRNAIAIWQDPVADCGLPGSYQNGSTFCPQATRKPACAGPSHDRNGEIVYWGLDSYVVGLS